MVTVAALIGPVSACASPVPPEGPWLAFPAGDALGLSGVGIKGMAADGSGRVVISGGYEADIVPDPFSTISWSADGAWLAFGGSKGPRKGIYELHPDGSGTRFLHGTDGGKNPVFSPDGSKLAFVRSNLKVGAATTWLADADGRKAVRLTPRSRAVEYLPSSFSPDGSVLAVTRKALRTNSSKSVAIRAQRASGGSGLGSGGIRSDLLAGRFEDRTRPSGGRSPSKVPSAGQQGPLRHECRRQLN